MSRAATSGATGGPAQHTGGTILSRVAWWSLCALVVLVPLMTTNLTGARIGSVPLLFNDPGLAKLVVLLVLVATSGAAWGLDQITSVTPKLRFTRVLWGVLASLAWIALASATAVDRTRAFFGSYQRFEGFVTWLAYALAFFVALQLADSPSKRRTLAMAAVISATVGAVWGVAQFAGVDPTVWGTLRFESNRAFGTFGNPDLFAGWLVLTLPVALALAINEVARGRAVAWWLCSALIAVALLGSFVRGAWIATVVALALLAWALVRRAEKLRPVDGVMAAVGVAGVGAAALASLRRANEVTNVASRLASTVDFGGGSALTRLLIWKTALSAAADRPLLGWGTDSFVLGFARWRSTQFTRTAGALELADTAHDLPLHLAVSVGVPGALLVLGTLASAMVRAWRHAFGRASDADLIAAGLYCGAAGYLAHLALGVSMPGTTALLWVVLGALLAQTARIVELPTLIVPVRAAAIAVIGVAWLVTVGFAFTHVRADVLAQRSLHSPDAEARVALAAAAARIAPFAEIYAERHAIAQAEAMRASIETAIQQQASGTDPQAEAAAARAHGAAAEQVFRELAERRRYDPDAWATLVGIQLQQGEAFSDKAALQRARTTAEEALAFLPEDPIVLVRLGAAQLALGDRAGAASSAQAALDRDPAYAAAQQLLDSAR